MQLPANQNEGRAILLQPQISHGVEGSSNNTLLIFQETEIALGRQDVITS